MRFISRLWTEQRAQEHGNESSEIIQVETETDKAGETERNRPPRSAGQHQAAEHAFIGVPAGEEDGQENEEVKAENPPKLIKCHRQI